MGDFPQDVLQAAWQISARHLTRGEKNVNLMIADAILLERQRCAQLAEELAGEDLCVASAIRAGQDGPVEAREQDQPF